VGISGEDVDARADTYLLGVILYELLTAAPIEARRLKQAVLTEMVGPIRGEQPSKPSTRRSADESAPSLAARRQAGPRRLMAILRGDVNRVVPKCPEKVRDAAMRRTTA
jgi:eukaryotic-like serine/threonine-protein kinase